MTISFNEAGIGESAVLLIICQISVLSIDSCSLNNCSENRDVHRKRSREEKVVTETGPVLSGGNSSAQPLINNKSITHTWLPKFLKSLLFIGLNTVDFSFYLLFK